jgi:dTDP-glucose pyrophosphorylase
MDLVICMAGRNTRFHDLGYDIPKYLLPFPKATVIQSIVNSLNISNIFDRIYLVAHERDIYFKDELVRALNDSRISGDNLFYIGETSGQAETAYLATKLISRSEDFQVVFHNADTILFNRDLIYFTELLNFNSGFVDTFYANSEKYSYVELNEDKIINIVEKKVISNHATSGLYGFASCREYQKYFLELKNSPNSTSNFQEVYISDVIKHMIRSGKKFKTKLNSIDQKTLVLGSPKEYIEALKTLDLHNHDI